VVPYLHISYIYALGFIYLGLRLWLEVLVKCVPSIVLFTMFRQDYGVARLLCGFSLLDWKYDSVIKHLLCSRYWF
jgi:hypothetical protein